VPRLRDEHFHRARRRSLRLDAHADEPPGAVSAPCDVERDVGVTGPGIVAFHHQAALVREAEGARDGASLVGRAVKIEVELVAELGSVCPCRTVEVIADCATIRRDPWLEGDGRGRICPYWLDVDVVGPPLELERLDGRACGRSRTQDRSEDEDDHDGPWGDPHRSPPL